MYFSSSEDDLVSCLGGGALESSLLSRINELEDSIHKRTTQWVYNGMKFAHIPSKTPFQQSSNKVYI